MIKKGGNINGEIFEENGGENEFTSQKEGIEASTQRIEHHMLAIFADTENDKSYGHGYVASQTILGVGYYGGISLVFANASVLGPQD